MASGKRKREETSTSHQRNKSDEPNDTSINPALKAAVIDHKKKCSNVIMEARKQLFEQQVQLTKNLRGNANVKYARFASSSDEPSSSVVYGVGHDWPKLGKYGYGVHLTPVDSGHNSATICDVDNGIRCVVLCRVILGDVEVALPGSKQHYPSAECYDTGVDNLENPTHYAVWSMNMKTHIYPEYSVSFKTSPNAEAQSREGLLQSVGSSTSRSRGKRFSKFLKAIADKISPSELQQVKTMYESFKEMSHEEFARWLISTVGNQRIRSALSILRSSAFQRDKAADRQT